MTTFVGWGDAWGDTPWGGTGVDAAGHPIVSHSSGTGERGLRQRGNRHTLYHRGPFVEWEGPSPFPPPILVSVLVTPPLIGSLATVYAPALDPVTMDDATYTVDSTLLTLEGQRL